MEGWMVQIYGSQVTLQAQQRAAQNLLLVQKWCMIKR